MKTSFRWAAFFLFGLIGWLAVSRLLGAPRQPVAAVLDEAALAALENLPIKNFEPSAKAEIKKNLRPLLTQQCSDTMKRVGLRSPLEVIRKSGLVIRPDIDLYNYRHTELGLVYERTRRELWAEFISCRAQAGTVYPMRNGIQLTTDGRPIIFLHGSAFWGDSPWLGKLSLHQVLVHEFIHAGGQPPTPGWFFFRHDLSGYEHYDEIMEACS